MFTLLRYTSAKQGRRKPAPSFFVPQAQAA
jgi:hypothetical protein